MRRIYNDATGKHEVRPLPHGAMRLLANLVEIAHWHWLFERAR